MQTAIVVYAFDKVPDIESLLEDFLVIIVAENSFVGSINPAAIVLRNKNRLGEALSLKRGFEFALKTKPDFVVSYPGDNSYNWQSIYSMMTLTEQADLVIGSRLLPFSSYEGSSAGTLLTGWVCRQLQANTKQRDWDSALRIYSADLLKSLLSYTYLSLGSGAYQIELLARANELGATVIEYPVSFRSCPKTLEGHFSELEEKVKVLHSLLGYTEKPSLFTREDIR